MVKIGELLDRQELIFSWTTRELKVRYSQAFLGIAWAILQPLALMLIFSLVFSVFIRIPSEGVPYPVFAYTALLPWTFFANGINSAVPSLVNHMNLVSKISFPREIIPLSAILVSLVDFLFASIVYVVLLVIYQISIGPAILLLPFLLGIQIVLTFGLSLFGSALNVFYRDIRFLVPLLIQVLFYLSPVIYPSQSVPERFRGLYFLNPLAALFDAYRQVILFNRIPALGYIISAGVLSLGFTVFAYWYFKRAEREFADLI